MYSAQNKSDYEVIKKCEVSRNIAVSICIVSYNVEKYIEKCLNSVCQQTFQKIEIIIVDDMSTDGTREKLYKFAKKNDNVTLIYMKKNSKVGRARNVAISNCNGKYVIALDSDDYIPSTAINDLYSAVGDADVAIGSVALIEEDGGAVISRFGISETVKKVSPFDNFLYFYLCTGYHYALLIKKSCIIDNNIHYKEGAVCSSDGYFIFSLVDVIDKISIINKITYFYRQTPNSIMHKPRGTQYYIDDFLAYAPLLESKKFDENFHLKRFIIFFSEFMNQDYYNICNNFSYNQKEILIKFLIKFFNTFNISEKIIDYAVRIDPHVLDHIFILDILLALKVNNIDLLHLLFSLPTLDNLALTNVKLFFLKKFCDEGARKEANVIFKSLRKW